MRTGARRPSGFSLIEIGIAVLILAFVLMPVFFLFRQGMTGTVQTRDEVLAYACASDLLQLARALPFDDPLLAVGPPRDVPTLPGPGSANPLSAALPPRFTRTLAVEEVSGAAEGNPFSYKVLTVEVHWKSGGTARHLPMTGLLFRVAP